MRCNHQQSNKEHPARNHQIDSNNCWSSSYATDERWSTVAQMRCKRKQWGYMNHQFTMFSSITMFSSKQKTTMSIQLGALVAGYTQRTATLSMSAPLMLMRMWMKNGTWCLTTVPAGVVWKEAIDKQTATISRNAESTDASRNIMRHYIGLIVIDLNAYWGQNMINSK